MIIGNFTYDKTKDTYAGEIQTLTMPRSLVSFQPTETKSDKGPNYRFVCLSGIGLIELGAAWKRTSEAGRDFLSVSIDDPALDKPLNAALMPSDDGKGAILIWSRSTKRETQAN